MMKKVFLLLAIALLVNTHAQHVCGTAEPTQAEYAHIRDVVANYQIHKNAGTTCIPIKPVIVREDNGSGGLSMADLNTGISYLNEYYYPAGIEFFICGSGPVYVNNSNYYDFQTPPSSTDEDDLAAAAGEDGTAINMYFVEGIDYTGGSSYTAGYAYLPNPFISSTRIILKYDDVADGGTIIHEMGHHFGLLHTFSEEDGTPTLELVDGTNCTTAGDLICDTPADPGFTGSNFNYTTCSYTPSAAEVDANNQQYSPMTENVMSYFPNYAGCPAQVLTADQITRIQQGLVDRQNYFAYNQYDYSCSGTNVTNPSNLVATLNGTDVDLTWTDNANNETGYLIEVSTTSATAGFRAYGGLSTAPNITSLTHNAGATTGRYYYRVKASNDGCNDYSNVDSVIITTTCDAGNISSTLINTTVDYCPNTSITLQTDGSHYIPTGEEYIWAFATATDTNYYNVNSTNYTGDLNSSLTTPIPAGTYTIYGVVTENGGVDLCDFTTGSFTINVLDQSNPACAATACDAGLINAALTGTTVDYCPGGSITLDTDSTYQIPSGGTYNFVFLNAGVDTFVIGTGPYYSGDLNSALTTPMPPGTYTVFGAIDNGSTYCSTTTDYFTINILDTSNSICANACLVGDVDPSLSGNTYDYCPGSTVDLLTDGTQVIPTGESYAWIFINATDTSVINVAGGNYSGDINADLAANGFPTINAGTYTVFAALTENNGTSYCGATPSSFTVNVLAANDPACSNPCSITDISPLSQSACFSSSNTYTQSVTITYTNAPTGTINVNGQTFNVTTSPQTVVLTTLNADGNPVDVTAFFTNSPSCTYTETAVFTAPPPCAPVCDITSITAGTQSICDPVTNTYTQDVILTYANPAAGAINVNGQVVVVGTSPQTVTLTNLNADGNDVDVTAFFTANTNCSRTETAVFTAPFNCTPVCDITDITAGTQSTCDPNTNTYTQDVTITYSNAPTGTINVNGQTFNVTTSPQTVTLTGLTANSNAVDVTAFFTNNNTCTFTENSAFTAPTSCAVIPCSISDISAGTQTACDPATDTYTQEVTITYSNAPSGTIEVYGQVFAQTNSPQTVTLTNLPSDGNAVDVTAFFTNDNTCTFTENSAFTAPVSCAAPTCAAGLINASLTGTTVDYCPGGTITLDTDSSYTIPSGGYYNWVFLNPGVDTFVIAAGPYYTGDINAALATPMPAGTYVVFGAVDDGATYCSFTNDDFTINILAATDPACSAAACSAGDVSAALNGSTINYCPGTNIDLITDGNDNVLAGEGYFWVFINTTDTVFVGVGPNYTGDINADLVANGATAIPAGTYTVFGLTTDGGGTNICDITPGDFTVNVLAANDPACTSPCSITSITTGTQTACDVATNSYSQEVTITYANAPSGTINVNGQTFNVTGSPQTVTLVNLVADGNPTDITAFFTNSSTCSYTETAAYTAPVACGVSPCSITAITAGAQSACDVISNTYSQEITISYTNAPTGTIEVNGQVFNATGSPQTVTLSNLTANGNNENVTAFFTNDVTCTLTENNVFTAATSCISGGPTDTLIVIMYPDGAGTLYVGNDVINTTPFVGVYPSNSVINIAATVTGTNTFDFWRLNNQSLIDYSPSTSFAFINQDTLFAYFNGAVAIGDVSETFNTFNIYPTVFDNQINVEFEVNENADIRIDLFSIEGKLMNNLFHQNINSNAFHKETFNVNVSSGMYFIKVTTENSSFSHKIIKY